MTNPETIVSVIEKKFYDLLEGCKGSRKLVLVIVAIGLLLDNMLLTSVGMNCRLNTIKQYSMSSFIGKPSHDMDPKVKGPNIKLNKNNKGIRDF